MSTAGVLDVEMRARDRASRELDKVGKSFDKLVEKQKKQIVTAKSMAVAETEAKRQLREMGIEVDKQASLSEKAGAAWTKFAVGLGVAAGAVYAAKRALGAIADTSTLVNAFQAAGLSIEEAQRRTSGMVAETDLMRSRMELANAEVAITNDQFGLLAVAAANMADMLGTTTTEAMDRLVQSMVSGQARGLKLLGVIVDEKAAVEEWASAHGTTADKLSATDERAAKLGATLKLLEERYGPRATAQVQNFGDEWDQVGAEVADTIHFWTGLAAAQADASIKQMNATTATLGLVDVLRSGTKDVSELAVAVKGYDAAQADAAKVGEHSTYVLLQNDKALLQVARSTIAARDADVAAARAKRDLNDELVAGVAFLQTDMTAAAQAGRTMAAWAAANRKATKSIDDRAASIRAAREAEAGEDRPDPLAAAVRGISGEGGGAHTEDPEDLPDRIGAIIEGLGIQTTMLGDATGAVEEYDAALADAMRANEDFASSVTGWAAPAAVAFTQAIESVVAGEVGFGAAMASMARSVISGVASQAAVKAVYELAEGIAAASNPFTAPTAPGHFAAAKLFAGIAAGAAVAAGAVGAATGAGKGSRGGGGAGAARAGGETAAGRDSQERGEGTIIMVFGGDRLHTDEQIARRVEQVTGRGISSGTTRRSSQFRGA